MLENENRIPSPGSPSSEKGGIASSEVDKSMAFIKRIEPFKGKGDWEAFRFLMDETLLEFAAGNIEKVEFVSRMGQVLKNSKIVTDDIETWENKKNTKKLQKEIRGYLFKIGKSRR